MKHSTDFTKMKYSEWLGSLLGACFIAFALGIWLHSTFKNIAWLIVVVGVLLHSWGMYKMYQGNK